MLTELDTFVRVVEAGSFSAAARKLRVPTSTVSRAVLRLEQSLRASLLFRTSGALTLTETGRALYEQAAMHLERLRDVQLAFSEGETQLKGVLRLTAPTTLAEVFLGELLVRFGTRHPQLRVEVDLSARAVDLVREGFDVALRAAVRLKDDDALVACRVASSEVQFFAAPDYLARRGAPRTPEELVDHDCVLFRTSEGVARWQLEGPGASRTVQVTGRLASNDLSFVRTALRTGAGIGPLPSYFVTEDLRTGRLVRVLPEWRRDVSGIFVVYPASRQVPRKVAAFRDFAVETFRQLGADASAR
jgi:DNA-binding transcriptional LysR family regulator